MTEITSLVSLDQPVDILTERSNDTDAAACSLVVVKWDEHVLFGFNVDRSQWELPGGSLDPGESSNDAALRELAEETGIRVDQATLVARAVFRFEGSANKYGADIFKVELADVPDLVESDEMCDFRWWEPEDILWDGMSALDAEVVRRIQSRDFESHSSRQ
jgi:8-oxo-dGTP diphosphatase